jgi:hypothetical protein
MRRILTILSVLSMFACAEPGGLDGDVVQTEAPDTEVREDGDPTDVAKVPCTTGIAWMQPGDEATHVSVDAEFTIEFSEPLPEDAVWTLNLDGVAGEARVSVDRMRARFFPNESLLHRQQYTLRASVCDVVRVHDFTTSPPPVPPPDLVGRTWMMRFDELTWLSPPSAAVFAPLLDLDALLVQASAEPSSSGGQELRLEVVLGEGPGHRVTPIPCIEPVDVGRVDLSSNPVFVTAPVDLYFPFGDELLVSPRTQIFGTFEDDGARIVEVDLIGLIDVRVLTDALPGMDICAISASLGEPCQACPDGVVGCLEGLAHAAELVELPDYDLRDAVSTVSADTWCPSTYP